MPDKKRTELIHPGAEGFSERVTPKKPDETIFFFHCPECGGAHFRHAGYLQMMAPFMRPGNEKRVAIHDERVMVCVKCRKSYCWINEQMYDVSDKIDLAAWEAAETELNKATGPGGEC